jgi:hypothetical protein
VTLGENATSDDGGKCEETVHSEWTIGLVDSSGGMQVHLLFNIVACISLLAFCAVHMKAGSLK